MESAYRVIIAEDEPILRRNIAKRITESKYEFSVVDVAANGEAALELIRTTNPHVLFTDIKMPILDGLELLSIVHNEYPNVKTMIISGYDDFEYARKALILGAAGYLLKPIKNLELEDSLSRLKIILDSENLELEYPNGNPRTQNANAPEHLAEMVDEFLLDNFRKNINLELISDYFGFHPTYLGRIYKKYKEITPIQRLISLKMNSAKHMLRNNPELSIHEIGEAVGYENQPYFSRIFKKFEGVSPLDYRGSATVFPER